MADDTPPSSDDGGFGRTLGHSLLTIAKAVGYGLASVSGEVRASRDRHEAEVNRMIQSNPDLLNIPEFAKAFQKHMNLSDESMSLYRARTSVGGVVNALAKQLGISTTQPQMDEYDQQVGGRLAEGQKFPGASGEAATLSPESVSALRARPQVPVPAGDILKQAEGMMLPGQKLEIGGTKSGVKLTVGKGTGATTRLADQAKLTSQFLNAFDQYKQQGLKDVEAARAAGKLVTDYASANGMALPDIITKAATYDARASQAGDLQRIMQQARSNVQLAMTAPIEEAKQDVIQAHAGPVAAEKEKGRRGVITGEGSTGASTQLGPGYEGIPTAPHTLPPELSGPTGQTFVSPDGRPATEIMMTVESDGRFYNVPLLVPGQKSVKDLLAGKPPTPEQLQTALTWVQLHQPSMGYPTRQAAATAEQTRHAQIEQHFQNWDEGQAKKGIYPGGPSGGATGMPQTAEEWSAYAAKHPDDPAVQKQFADFKKAHSSIKGADTEATVEGRYAGKRKQTAGEIGETFAYPQESARAGELFSANEKVGDILDQGGIQLSKRAAQNYPQLSQATDFFLNWPKAGKVLFQQGDTSPLFRSAEYAGIQLLPGAARTEAIRGMLDNGLLPLPGGVPNTAKNRMKATSQYADAITKMEEIRNNLIIMLRSGMGERGNFAKAIVDKALKSGPTLWDDAITSNTRMRFMAGMLAASKLAQGIPLTQREMQAYQQLDDDAEASGLSDKLNIKQLATQYGFGSMRLKDALVKDMKEQEGATDSSKGAFTGTTDERTQRLRAILSGATAP